MDNTNPPPPPKIINAAMQAGTATLLDGTPIVFIDTSGLRFILRIPNALQLGLELIRQTEHATTNTILLQTLTEKGMSIAEAMAMVQAFQDQRKKLLIEQIDDAVKKDFTAGPDAQ